MKYIHTFFYTSMFYAMLLLLALFNGVQISLPLPENEAKQAQLDSARSIMASSVFDAVDHKGRK